MNILEENLINDLDLILLEEYPPIFMQLDKKIRDIISNTFAVGPNSKQIDIDRTDIRKYGDGLIITTDEEFTPVGYMLGSSIGKLPTSPFDIGDIDSRPKMIRKSTHFFYITPDEKGWEKINSREKRGEIDKPEYEEIFRKRPTDGFGTKVKREIPKGYKEEFNKRIESYLKKKQEVYQNILPLIKKNLIRELEKEKNKYIENVKKNEEDFDIYTFNKKYKSIVGKMKVFDDTFYNFNKDYKNMDKDSINTRITDISIRYEDIKKELKKIK